MKRKIIMILLASLLLCSCGAVTEPVQQEIIEEILEEAEVQKPTFDIDDYKAKALALKELLFNDSTIMVNVAKSEVDILENIEKLGGLNPTLSERNITTAFTIYKSSQDEINTNSNKIKQLYKDFILIETDDSKEAKEIESSIREMYDSYTIILDAVQTVGAKKNTLGPAVLEAGKAIVPAAKNIDLFCEE